MTKPRHYPYHCDRCGIELTRYNRAFNLCRKCNCKIKKECKQVEVPSLDANEMLKECLQRQRAYLLDQISKMQQGLSNIDDDLKRLEKN